LPEEDAEQRSEELLKVAFEQLFDRASSFDGKPSENQFPWLQRASKQTKDGPQADAVRLVLSQLCMRPTPKNMAAAGCDDQFLLGIECDGATYHSSKSARDRDRLREQVIRSRGWELHRVWSTDWFLNRESEERRLRKAILAQVQARTKGEPPPIAQV
jgi:hypothetical protein